MNARTLLLPLLMVVVEPACAAFGAPMPETPMRSPSMDYPPPPVETADGQVLGADGMRVEDKLRTSPRIGLEGLTPSEAPIIEERRPSPSGAAADPLCKVLGVDTAVRLAHCPTSTMSKP
jgi:hypothetical protein